MRWPVEDGIKMYSLETHYVDTISDYMASVKKFDVKFVSYPARDIVTFSFLSGPL